MKKILTIVVAVVIIVLLFYFFVASAPRSQHINWGVNFSKEYTEFLGLDWKETYLAMLNDLGIKHIKLLTQWDGVEREKDIFSFQDVDWQLDQVKDSKVSVIYVVGMKTGRWPECHLPYWANYLKKEQQQSEILEYVEKTVLRYKGQKSIIAWQAENEPFYNFGVCPWYDEDFLKKEVTLIKSLDPSRPVIVSDTGEQSLWLKAAKIGDIVGVTMYRQVWVHITDKYGFYFDFPLPAISYFNRAQIIKSFFNKEVINVELQAEPWVSSVSNNSLLKEENSMNASRFKNNIQYAKKSGLDTFYLWGAEWWYYMKEKQNNSEVWDEARKLFSVD